MILLRSMFSLISSWCNNSPFCKFASSRQNLNSRGLYNRPPGYNCYFHFIVKIYSAFSSIILHLIRRSLFQKNCTTSKYPELLRRSIFQQESILLQICKKTSLTLQLNLPLHHTSFLFLCSRND